MLDAVAARVMAELAKKNEANPTRSRTIEIIKKACEAGETSIPINYPDVLVNDVDAKIFEKLGYKVEITKKMNEDKVGGFVIYSGTISWG